MLNVVYPYTSSAWGEELKYSLRSLDKHLKTEYRVLIYGTEIPEWLDLTKVEFIKTERYISPKGIGRTQFNQGLLFQKIINRGDIENFVFFNDDIYLLRDQDSLDHVYMHSVGADPHTEPNSGNIWHKTLRETRKTMVEMGHSFYNYETHLPYPISVEKLRLMRKVLTGQGLLATTYYNRENFGKKQLCSEVKTGCYNPHGVDRARRKLAKGESLWFNHDDSGLELAQEFLPKAFPEKSKFELCS